MCCPQKRRYKANVLAVLHLTARLLSSLLRSERRHLPMNEHLQAKRQRSRKTTDHTTNARATAQRAKLEAQAEVSSLETASSASSVKQKKRKEPQRLLSHRRTSMT